jgi:hypothetical protein
VIFGPDFFVILAALWLVLAGACFVVGVSLWILYELGNSGR